MDRLLPIPTSRFCWLGRSLFAAPFAVVFAVMSTVFLVSPVVGQMLQPDRGGWAHPQNEQPLLDPWPAPPDRIASQESVATALPAPDSFTRHQIGLASFEEPVKVQNQRMKEPESVAPPVRELPQRDATTDPFLTFASAVPQPASAPVSEPKSEPQSRVAIGNGTTDFSSLGQVFSGADSVLPRNGLDSSIKAMLLLAALSLAPAMVLMTTSYVRVVVVLSLLRQAFGSQQLPPTQVITALSLFLTMLVMAPVWNEVKSEAIDPYSAAESEMTWQAAWDAGLKPVRQFMQKQIQLAGNEESIATFYHYLPETSQQPPSSFDEVPFNVLLPAFMVSELKVAFLLGFQVFLPFLVLDLVVSSVTVSMGMLMLPPNMVSFPLKLILFVMVDGWNLVIGMLLQSFGPFS